jgi:hypothetical protein
MRAVKQGSGRRRKEGKDRTWTRENFFSSESGKFE